ncbi:MAG TPA: zinc ribbon domain-containing protein [Planctomycetota bacterium]|jgi:hypothetical protein
MLDWIFGIIAAFFYIYLAFIGLAGVSVGFLTQAKGRGFWSGFFLGCGLTGLFSFIGWIIALLIAGAMRPQMTCPRCQRPTPRESPFCIYCRTVLVEHSLDALGSDSRNPETQLVESQFTAVIEDGTTVYKPKSVPMPNPEEERRKVVAYGQEGKSRWWPW